MRNDYKQRPRPALKGGGIAMRGMGQALKKGGKADMITARMSKKKKGKMMKGKR